MPRSAPSSSSVSKSLFPPPGLGLRGATRAKTPPAVADLLTVTSANATLDSKSRAATLDAMQSATTKRVDGILGNKRRRHYRHAATLAARCVELAPMVGKHKPIATWTERLRKEYSRFYAFQKELRGALASISS